jgi:hypothetical protein
MRGAAAPSNPQTQGAHPPSGNPLMYLLYRDVAEKEVTFLNNISQTKTSVGGLTKAFFSSFGTTKKGGGVKKALKALYICQVMG